MILLKNCFAIATLDEDGALQGEDSTLGQVDRALSGWDILIEDGRIREVEREISTPGARMIDCSRCAVVPGFVNTHHHFFQTLTRNLPAVQNAKLFDWLVYLYEVWKNIDEEAVLTSSLVAIGELLKTGCTCTTDHHYLYPKSFSGDLMGIQFEAASKLGIRFSPSRGSMSLSRKDGGLPPDSVVQSEEDILRDSRRVLETYHDARELSMRRVTLAPCSPFSVTERLMRETAELAREYGVRLHTHLAETRDEDDYCINTLGKRPLALMQEWGFLGEDVSFAHGIHFNDSELDVLAETETSIAHCPSSNMRLGSGIARVKEMLGRGINVALAVDGSASNDSSDFLGEMRNAMYLQRVRYGADALTVRDTYKIATENGARLLGFPRIGKIKPGWAADLALFNIDKLEYAGSLSDPVAALVFCGISHQTEYTIAAGKIVVEKGKLTGADEAEITRNANRIAKKILE